MPKKGNKLKFKKAWQQVKAVSPQLGDQAGFVSGVNSGRLEVTLLDGSRIRNIRDESILTNAGLGISDPVYVVIREGVPLIDSVRIADDFTGIETLTDQLSTSNLVFPWIGVTDTDIDLIISQLLSLGNIPTSGAICYGDRFLFYQPLSPTVEVPEDQPYYLSCLNNGAIEIREIFEKGLDEALILRSASLSGATYLGATCFYRSGRVISGFEDSQVGIYPSQVYTDNDQFDAVPIGGQCFALSRRKVGSDVFNSSGFRFLFLLGIQLEEYLGNVQQSLQNTNEYHWGYPTSQNTITTYDNFEDKISPVVAGQNLALYTAKEQGVRTISSDAKTTSDVNDPSLLVEVEASGGNGPPRLITFLNNILNLDIAPFGAGTGEFDDYGGGGSVRRRPYGRWRNISYAEIDFVQKNFKPQSPEEFQLVASDNGNYSDPLSLGERSPRSYRVSIVSGSLGTSNLSLRIDTGGYSGSAFGTRYSRVGTASESINVTVDVLTPRNPNLKTPLELSSTLTDPRIVFESIEGNTYPADYGPNGEYANNGNTYHRASGAYNDNGVLKEAPGLGAFRFETETTPGYSISEYEYEANPRFTPADFAGTWILVVQSTGLRYWLTFTGSNFNWATAPAQTATESVPPTLTLDGSSLDFIVLASEPVDWDAIAGDIADMDTGAMILYPESSPLPFNPRFTQLLANDASFNFTIRDSDGPGLSN